MNRLTFFTGIISDMVKLMRFFQKHFVVGLSGLSLYGSKLCVWFQLLLLESVVSSLPAGVELPNLDTYLQTLLNLATDEDIKNTAARMYALQINKYIGTTSKLLKSYIITSDVYSLTLYTMHNGSRRIMTHFQFLYFICAKRLVTKHQLGVRGVKLIHDSCVLGRQVV